MKAVSIILILSLVGLSLQAIDYTDAKNEFDSCTDNPETGYKSPIQIQFSQCGPYDTFDLKLKDIADKATGDTTLGNFKLPYTDGKLTVNGREFTSTMVAFHHQAEHVLYGNDQRHDLEMQITMKDKAGKTGILSFLFYTTEAADPEKKAREDARKKLQVVNELSTDNWDLQLSAIPAAINNKLSSDAYLNLYTYEGTTTDKSCTPATWFIYASPLYVRPAQITSFVKQLNNADSSVLTAASGGKNAKSTTLGGGSQSATKLCYTGYFQVRMDVNYGLWFAIGILLLYFIFTLSMDIKPETDFEYKENAWTHHPIYSVYRVGNDIFTRKTRASLILVSLINQCMWNSVWFRIADPADQVKGENVIIFALQSIPIGWFFYYWFGFMLRKYYQEKYKWEETRNESHDNKAQFYIFIFYFMVFVAIWVGFSITVWNMNELQSYIDDTPSNLWVATLFVGIALEWLFFDIIAAFLAVKSESIRDFFRWKGFIYDDLCHKTYLLSIKRD